MTEYFKGSESNNNAAAPAAAAVAPAAATNGDASMEDEIMVRV